MRGILRRDAGSSAPPSRVDPPLAMSDDPAPTRCFRCGGPANQLNELEEGQNCPACAERLLETLQGVFHAPWGKGVVDVVEPAEDRDEVPAIPRPRATPSRSPWGEDPGPRRA